MFCFIVLIFFTLCFVGLTLFFLNKWNLIDIGSVKIPKFKKEGVVQMF